MRKLLVLLAAGYLWKKYGAQAKATLNSAMASSGSGGGSRAGSTADPGPRRDAAAPVSTSGHGDGR